MKLMFVVFVCLIITGCASTSQIQLYDGDKLPQNDVSLITSSCNTKCQTIIESNVGVTQKLYGPKISGVVVQSINGKQGQTNYGGHRAVFNDVMWFQYNLETLPGAQKVEVFVNYHMARAPKKIKLEFTTKAGHNYFLGQVLDMPYLSEGAQYKWTPVVVDLTSHKFVDLGGQVGWIHYPGK